MAPKSLVLVALLVVVVFAADQVAAALGASPQINSSVIISGIVPCATGNFINAATAPAFPNAAMQLMCGSNVVAGTTADGNGAFHISLVNVRKDLLTALVDNQCKVVVVTPLAACDKSLATATGTLTAPLKLLGIDTGTGGLVDLGGIIGTIVQIVSGLIGGILNMGTQAFSLV
ncbi:unnamed protein product [Urochloa humidicola]